MSIVDNLENIIKEMDEKMLTVEEIKKIDNIRKKLETSFLSQIEAKINTAESMEEKKELLNLYNKYIQRNFSDMVQKIANIGFRYRNELGDDFRKVGYKLLEQTRIGQKNEVEYMITRIFVANGKNIPLDLIEVFKSTDINIFKTFIYAFLGSIIKEKEE